MSDNTEHEVVMKMGGIARTSIVMGALLLATLKTSSAEAFCGFYVNGSGAQLSNRATQVVLVREGTRTVLSMQNNYEGPPESFAMVVPVPTVLQQENVKTLPRDVFVRVDELSAPRLVEYWEQDPCSVRDQIQESSNRRPTATRRPAPITTMGAAVRVEAQFAVGEYDVVVLSADDSNQLETWLTTNAYHIPSGASAALEPYVRAGMKFFVAKVDVKKLAFVDGRAKLSPLRFWYDSTDFSLPVRLGLLNSSGDQDLIVNILAPNTRYEVANYPNALIPTNLEVVESVREDFAPFYNALFDHVIAQKPNTVVTEYAWDPQSCDPCPGPTLSNSDVLTLGGDVLPSHQPTPSRTAEPQSAALLAQAVAEGLVGTSDTGPSLGLGGTNPYASVQSVLRRAMPQFRSCYQSLLRTGSSWTGQVSLRLVLNPTTNTALAASATSTAPATFNRCIETVSKQLRFTISTTAPMTLRFPINFSGSEKPQGDLPAFKEAPAVAYGIGSRSDMPSPMRLPVNRPPMILPQYTNFVLTRLHVRYNKSVLTDDLVFKPASAISGGSGSPPAALETEAKASANNQFQARYIIKHPWTGPVQCSTPVRNVWGGRPGDGPSSPRPARDLAFATRGTASLASQLRTSLTDLRAEGPAPVIPVQDAGTASVVDAAVTTTPSTSSTTPSSTTPTSQKKGCGACTTTTSTVPMRSVVLVLAGAIASALARRRSRE